MKRIALSTVLLAAVLNVHAQTVATSETSSASNNNHAQQTNEDAASVLGAITMDRNNNIISFGTLPDNQVVKAYVTNADGTVMTHYRLTTAKNTIDVTGLPPGEYDINLVNKNNRRSLKIKI